MFGHHCFWLSRTTWKYSGLSPASSGDNRCGADVGTPADCTRFVEHNKQREETNFGSTDNGGLDQADSSGIMGMNH